MWECLLGIRHRGCPISDASATVSNVSVQNVSRVDITDDLGRRLLHLRVEPEDIDAFERTCEDHDLVESAERVTENDPSEAYFAVDIRYETGNPSVLSTLNSRGVFHHGAIAVLNGVEHWLVYSEEKSTIQGLRTELESNDNDVFLYRMVDLSELDQFNDIESGFVLPQLTERQRLTFRTALELGYYDGNSKTTVRDIADELELHETTAWEHLSKAENAILTDVGRRLFSSREPQKV